MPVRIASANDGRNSGAQRPLVLTVALAALLSGCMTAGDVTPPPPASAAPPVAPPDAAPDLKPASMAMTPRPRPKPVQREARVQPEPKPVREKPVIDPNSLIGLDPPAVQKLMGAPSRVKDDHLSREWVYASQGCNFRVFFYPNLNAASFRVLKYSGSDGNGERLAVSDACVRRILTARNNAAD